jgi:hypothetical protein
MCGTRFEIASKALSFVGVENVVRCVRAEREANEYTCILVSRIKISLMFFLHQNMCNR